MVAKLPKVIIYVQIGAKSLAFFQFHYDKYITYFATNFVIPRFLICILFLTVFINEPIKSQEIKDEVRYEKRERLHFRMNSQMCITCSCLYTRCTYNMQ